MASTRNISDCFRRSRSTEEERIPLLPRNKENADSSPEEKKGTDGRLQTENYHAIEVGLTEDQLLQQVEESITKKMFLVEHPHFLRRNCFNILSFIWISALLTAISDLAYHARSANHVTQQELAQFATDNIEPLWLAISPDCTQKTKENLGSPNECVDIAPRLRYADGGAYFISRLLHDPDLKFCNDNIIMLYRKCSAAPIESTELIKNLYKIAWKEQFTILFLAGIVSYFLYLKKANYDHDIALSLSDKTDLHTLTELEKNKSGIFFLNRNEEIDIGEILARLNLIKFSQSEIKKCQEYFENTKDCLESIFPEAVAKIIDEYSSYPARTTPKYRSSYAEWWKKNYANFFRSMTGEEVAIAEQGSTIRITFNK